MNSLALLSIISLIMLRLSYTDWKEKLVEVPITLYAMGFITAFYLIAQRYWEFLFWTIFVILVWQIAKPFFAEKHLIGEGDISVLSFLLPTTWFIHPYFLASFLILFGIVSLIGYRKFLFDSTDKPMMPCMTIALAITWIILRLTNII